MPTPETDKLFADRLRTHGDFYFFVRWMFSRRTGHKWLRGRHHERICNALAAVYSGAYSRLVINVPPRYSKSEIVVNFIAWSLGHNPDAEFIYTSYSGTLAEEHAGKIRNIVTHPAYRDLFPAVRLSKESTAHFKTTKGGVVYAAGSEGSITGFGAGKMRTGFGGALVIDDPIPPDEARSEAARQNAIRHFEETLANRLNSPRTPIILIMQRLHEDDLSGWLLRGGSGERWEHLCLPALDANGEALWPEKHDREALLRMQQAAPYSFSGQYQQWPAPPEGNVFRPDAIEIIDAVPADIEFVRAWDLAATSSDGDWTVGGKLGRLRGGRYVIADIRRFQGAPHEVEAAIVNAAKSDGDGCKVRLPQDPGQAGKSQIAYLTGQLAGYSVKSYPISGDKITRAEPFASQVNVGNVSMVRADWNDALISELRMFPNASHDDQVDALSDAFAELAGGSTFDQWMQYEAEQAARSQAPEVRVRDVRPELRVPVPGQEERRAQRRQARESANPLVDDYWRYRRGFESRTSPFQMFAGMVCGECTEAIIPGTKYVVQGDQKFHERCWRPDSFGRM
ncbi:MAG TPA: phage terminase large subunit [Steroidobacteraceae bacterium]|nr:phage terminase large subunit [Steroidobacteraceae bacterium]